jgi:deoxyribonuclease V
MKPVINHSWDVTIPEAREIQNKLANQLVQKPLPVSIKTIAAVDVSYTRWDRMGYAVLGIFSLVYDNKYNQYILKDKCILTAIDRVNFPYVPGYLSFREIPLLLTLFDQVDQPIDVIIADGAGIAHPRGMGLAAHLGLIFDLPSVGSAKSKLIGHYAEPGKRKGESTDLLINNRVVGKVLRSKDNCKPLFVSPGNKSTVDDAVNLILRLCFRYRICEPIRIVDQESKVLRKKQTEMEIKL